MESFDNCVSAALSKLKLDHLILKPQQNEVLQALFEGRDTLAVLPTGFGKSLVYQILPYMFAAKEGKTRPMICIVVAPINAIMEEQVRYLRSRGVMACSLSYAGTGAYTYEEGDEMEETEDKDVEERILLCMEVSMKELMDGNYHLIYTHPECLFRSKTVAKMLRSRLYQELICGIVIDEGHIVLEWGQEFRPKFQRLGELTCLYPHAAHLALTATADQETVNSLAKALLYSDYKIVAVNPDRPNIFIDKVVRPPNAKKIEKYDAFIAPLAEQLKNQLEKFPVTIAYVESLEALGYAYQYLNNTLRDLQYNGNEQIPENRLFAQYHTDYTSDMKKHIVADLAKDKPTTRLVLATVALGMGLNSPAIIRVMHMRPPVSLEHYLQEIGRAGRCGQSASAVMFYNYSDIAPNRKGIKQEMVDFCKNNETCLRLYLVNYFGFDKVLFSGSKKECCVNCRHKEDQHL